MAVLRRDAYKISASECAEYDIKLGTRYQILGIKECYSWTSQFIAALFLFTGRQLLVSKSIYICKDFCPLAISANILQYRPWDLGVGSSVCGILILQLRNRMQVMVLCSCEAHYRSWSCSWLQPKGAIAWGKAMFCRGGNITPDVPSGPNWNYGLPYMDLAQLIEHWSRDDKYRATQQERAWKKSEEKERNQLSSLSLSNLSLFPEFRRRSCLTSAIIPARGRGVTLKR
jgi:hypothetical protein